MALQHSWAGIFEFLLQRANNRGVIMPGVVYAVAGQKIQETAPIIAEELSAGTALVADIHLQHVQEARPLWIYVLSIELGRSRRFG